ncbi:MAG: RsmE family RNA methyltransferase [Candidatus Caenarcaniphilales bacterium]|nr:RsmE family RNA methyltransferase [Candidatus Caenarcaniphilales bacterium]
MKEKRIPRFVLLNGLTEIVDPDQIKQITKVFRLKIGDQIIGICEEKQFLFELSSISRDLISLKNIEEIIPEQSPENNFHLKLLIPLLKNDKTELVLQKCTELGANEFQFIEFDHSVKSANNLSHKLERWQKIILEAVEQSERLKIPFINEKTIKVQDIQLASNETGIVFLERLQNNQKSFNENHLNPIPKENTTLSLIFGPEGGFSEREKNLLIQKGFYAKSLGNRILRSETAIVVGCSHCSIYQ